MTIKGSCLCGGVRFEIDAARSLTFCHCSNCRKLSGAAFASYVHVDADKFRFTSGEELIQRFESAPGSFRNFCRVCSSTVPGKAAYLTTVSIPAGLFDDDPGVLRYVGRKPLPDVDAYRHKIRTVLLRYGDKPGGFGAWARAGGDRSPSAIRWAPARIRPRPVLV